MGSPLKTTGTLLLTAALLVFTRASFPTNCSRDFYDEKSFNIWVSDCGLKTIDVDAFEGLTGVEFLHLDGNKFKTIDPALFSPTINVRSLGLSKNRLRAVPPFGEHEYLPNLEWLNLHANRIGAITNPNTFTSLKKLETIDFSDNVIEYVHPDTFKSLPKLQELDFANNRLSVISDTAFQIKSLTRIVLSNNSIEYVPPGAFHGTKLKELYISDNRFSHLPSNFVKDLHNAGASLKRFFFNGSGWHCGCMLELIAELKEVGGVDYTRNYFAPFYGGNPACLYIGRSPCIRLVPSTLLPSHSTTASNNDVVVKGL